MFKKQHGTALAVMVLTTLVLLGLSAGLSQRLRTAISNVFLPLFGLSAAAHTAGETVGVKLTPRRQLERENAMLRRQNAQMKMQLLAAQQTERENQRLRQLVGWKRSKPWKLKLARVVLRDPANWWRAVQIDLGSRDGVNLNDPVMLPSGLVGRVSSVGYDHSQVILLGDPNCQVSATVDNQAQDTGIVGSSSGLDSEVVEMTYLPRHAKVTAGQPVISSDLGGLFPKGILIGHVLDTRLAEYGLYLTARVRLAVNLSALEEVWVKVQ